MPFFHRRMGGVQAKKKKMSYCFLVQWWRRLRFSIDKVHCESLLLAEFVLLFTGEHVSGGEFTSQCGWSALELFRKQEDFTIGQKIADMFLSSKTFIENLTSTATTCFDAGTFFPIHCVGCACEFMLSSPSTQKHPQHAGKRICYVRKSFTLALGWPTSILIKIWIFIWFSYLQYF